MSFLEILYIWLAVLLAAIVYGSIARIMHRHTRN